MRQNLPPPGKDRAPLRLLLKIFSFEINVLMVGTGFAFSSLSSLSWELEIGPWGETDDRCFCAHTVMGGFGALGRHPSRRRDLADQGSRQYRGRSPESADRLRPRGRPERHRR